MLNIEIVYADNQQQQILAVSVPDSCTVKQAIEQSGVLQLFPAIDWQMNKVAIFGKLVALTAIVQAGDRIEICRPLLIDPKQARKVRAKHQRTTVQGPT